MWSYVRCQSEIVRCAREREREKISEVQTPKELILQPHIYIYIYGLYPFNSLTDIMVYTYFLYPF